MSRTATASAGIASDISIRLSLTILDDRLEEGVRRMEALASGWGK